MKKLSTRHSTYLALGSTTLLVLYAFNIPPNIENPLSIAGFFGLMLICLFFASLSLPFIHSRKMSAYVHAAVIATSGVYITALYTLRSLDLVDLIAVTVVYALLSQILAGKDTR